VMARHEFYSDTDPKALEVFLARQRTMTATEKMEAVFQQNELLRRLSEARERQLHPDATDREIFLRVVAHRLGREAMLRIYGWHPDDAT